MNSITDLTFEIYILIGTFVVIVFLVYRQFLLNKQHKDVALEKERFQQLLHNAVDGIHIVDSQGYVVECSDSFAKMLGYTKEEVLKLHITDWDYTVSKEQIAAGMQNLRQKSDTLITKHTRKNGSTYDAQISIKAIKMYGSEYFYASVRDITEHIEAHFQLLKAKNQAEELNQEQQILLSLFDKGDAVLFKWKNSPNWDVEYVSQNVEKLFGYRANEFLENPLLFDSLINSDDNIRVTQEVNSAIEQHVDYYYHEPYRLKHKNGDERWIQEYTVTQKDEEDKIIYFIGYIIDITDSERMRKDFETIFQTTKDGLAILDLKSNFLDFNDAYLKLTGYDREELLRTSCIAMSAADYTEKAKQVVEEVIAKGHVTNFEKECITKDGYTILINMTLSLLPDKKRIVISTKDITASRKKELEIREKLQKIIDTQNSILILTDGKRLKYVNKAFLEFYGFKDLEEFTQEYNCICDTFVRKNNFFHPELFQESDEPWVESLLKLSGRKRVVSILNKNLLPHAFLVSINEFEDNDYIVSFSDISDNMVEKLELTKEATFDALTQVYNRIYFNKHINYILDTHQKDNMQTGIIMFDIDNFKTINDTYGHNVGDNVLKTLSFIVKKYTRNDDKVIRWGGEEFIILLEIENSLSLFNTAEHLRSVIQNYSFEHIGNITCSFGCAVHNMDHDILDTVKNADTKLYKAKNSGRNRVFC